MQKVCASLTCNGTLEVIRLPDVSGEGKLFSFDVLDAGGGEIRVTAFKQDADRFFDLIQVGNVYLISHGQVKPANRSFTHLKHEYEVTLGRESQIEQAPDEVCRPCLCCSSRA